MKVLSLMAGFISPHAGDRLLPVVACLQFGHSGARGIWLYIGISLEQLLRDVQIIPAYE